MAERWGGIREYVRSIRVGDHSSKIRGVSGFKTVLKYYVQDQKMWLRGGGENIKYRRCSTNVELIKVILKMSIYPSTHPSTHPPSRPPTLPFSALFHKDFRKLILILCSKIFFYFLIYFERERVCMQAGVGQRERGRKRIPSRLCTVLRNLLCTVTVGSFFFF